MRRPLNSRAATGAGGAAGATTEELSEVTVSPGWGMAGTGARRGSGSLAAGWAAAAPSVHGLGLKAMKTVKPTLIDSNYAVPFHHWSSAPRRYCRILMLTVR